MSIMKRVLVVEDDVFIRDITTIRLSEHGYGVSVAPDGTSALQILTEKTFDVVLLDLDLPDIQGYEILQQIRQSTTLKELPVIVFSNRDDETLKEKIKKLGVSGYYVKASTEFVEVFSCIDAL